MVALLWIIAAIIAIPVAVVVAWKALTFVLAIILDLGNLVWAFILVGIISLIVIFL